MKMLHPQREICLFLLVDHEVIFLASAKYTVKFDGALEAYYATINHLFVYSPSDTEHAVTAKLNRNNAIYSVDVFTLIMSLVHLARRQRIDRAIIESTATCSTKQHHK